jgi:hypothetical protein
VKLTPAQVEVLVARRNSVGIACELCPKLEALGLIQTGKSRFAHWVRLTEAGQQYVDRMSASGSRAAATRGSGDTEQLLNPRNEAGAGADALGPPNGARRVVQASNAAPQARRDPLAIRPPASALDVAAVLRLLTMKVIHDASS